jgi:hypothetical protein
MFDLAYKNLAILAGEHDASARRLDRIPSTLPDHFLGVIDDMRQELAMREVPLVLSTFLVKYRRGQPRNVQIANADVAFYYMPWMSIDGMLDAMEVYNNAILTFAYQHGLPVVDDREAVPADADNYSDCMHLLDKGSEAMAERFSRYLQRSRLIDSIVSRIRASNEMSSRVQ